MEKDYLITLKNDGSRGDTYANNIHYQVIEPQPIIKDKTDTETGETTEEVTGYTEEKIINLVDGFDYQAILDNGGVWFGVDDYNKLVGNAGKEYIYKNGQIVEKPAYVPTAEELQEQARAKLDAEYASKFSDKDNEIIKAVVVAQDAEYAEQLRQERTALTQEYITKRGAL